MPRYIKARRNCHERREENPAGGLTPEHKDGALNESALKAVTGGTYNPPAIAKTERANQMAKDALALADEMTKNDADNMP